MSAVEIARLANIALAEVGIGPVCYPTPPERLLDASAVGISWPAAEEMAAPCLKASRLARLSVLGPSYMTLCDAHPTRQLGGAGCAKVAVADALRGRLCLNAGVS